MSMNQFDRRSFLKTAGVIAAIPAVSTVTGLSLSLIHI